MHLCAPSHQELEVLSENFKRKILLVSQLIIDTLGIVRAEVVLNSHQK